jgi:hypothetical protein
MGAVGYFVQYASTGSLAVVGATCVVIDRTPVVGFVVVVVVVVVPLLLTITVVPSPDVSAGFASVGGVAGVCVMVSVVPVGAVEGLFGFTVSPVV